MLVNVYRANHNKALLPKYSYEECNSTVCSNVRIVLDISKDGAVISLLLKYYVPLEHINKAIKLLKFKSAVNLQCF